ncbi:MAG TPA: hypothetical protein VEJ87_14400 [Acidimicrobiales bacterium]|nr:hypothetical protein [Acidimicrobiales bacterium]
MKAFQTQSEARSESLVDAIAPLRTLTILGLLGIALIHLLDLPGTIGPSPVQGAGYLLIMAGCIATSAALLHAISPGRWVAAMVLGALPAGAYVLTRTVGLPFDTSDIGNWGDPLGTASLFVEGLVVVFGAYGFFLNRIGVRAGAPRLGRIGEIRG